MSLLYLWQPAFSHYLGVRGLIILVQLKRLRQHKLTQPVVQTQPVAVAQPLSMAPSSESVDSGVDAGKLGIAPQSACIKQLDSLKTFSPSDYKSMMSAFKEISEINAMYRSVQSTASKDSLDLLKMSIESKTEVLCAKVRYLSIMSVNSTLKKLGE
ncbi:hypothetical protein [Proteus penneri]|uniref:hypothetical protein n=1 Tax=Proteus penneri TaxID=102862 RepID=UPI001EFBA4AD|nr:hypothetical protein [Proteus penneri]